MRLLPACAGHIAAEAERVIASVSNALHMLASTHNGRAGEWIDAMIRLAPRCGDVFTLLQLGQLAAWRAGLAHFREGALALAPNLPTERVGIAIGAPKSPTIVGATANARRARRMDQQHRSDACVAALRKVFGTDQQLTIERLPETDSKLISIGLAALNNVHTWWTGILGCLLFGVLFFDSRSYADATLQAFFIATSAIGWWGWLRGSRGTALPVRGLTITAALYAAVEQLDRRGLDYVLAEGSLEQRVQRITSA